MKNNFDKLCRGIDERTVKEIVENHIKPRNSAFISGLFFYRKEKRVTFNQRARFLYEVLARQPINPIPMQIIRNSKDKLNERFGTHVKNMTRINTALRKLEKTGWVSIKKIKHKKFSTTRNEWYEEEWRDSVTVFKNKGGDK